MLKVILLKSAMIVAMTEQPVVSKVSAKFRGLLAKDFFEI